MNMKLMLSLLTECVEIVYYALSKWNKHDFKIQTLNAMFSWLVLQAMRYFYNIDESINTQSNCIWMHVFTSFDTYRQGTPTEEEFGSGVEKRI